MNEPVKCPDCATWWRGDEHRCNAEKPAWVDAMLDGLRNMPHVCLQPYYALYVPPVQPPWQPWKPPFIWSGTSTSDPLPPNISITSMS